MDKDDQPEQPEIDEAIRYFEGLMTPVEAASFRALAGVSEVFAQRALEVREVLQEFAALRIEPDPGVVAEVDKQQRALWWKHRLHLAGVQLSEQGQRYARLAEVGLEAAVEVTLAAVRGASRLLAGPASMCLRPDAGFSFELSAVGPAMKSKPIDGLGDRPEDVTAATGTFVTSRISGALVTVNEEGTSVTVEFLEDMALPDIVVLVPEDPALEPKVMRTNQNRRAVISGLEAGAYLLAVPEPGVD